MRMIVCGGRDFEDRERAFRALDAAHAKRPVTTIVHGSALGADWLAGEWGASRGVPVQMFVPDWDGHGKAAGPMRNQRMADAGADGCIAFRGGPGTADMVRRAEAAGIPVWKPYG